jgi:Protein of unknown function (DUF1549)/Protein of unknown function (DUF1553)
MIFRTTILSLLVSAAAYPAGLTVYPEKIQLDNARDPHRLVAVQFREDGVTRDVTSEAKITIEPATLAQWTDTRRLKPLVDGEGTVRVEYDGQTVTLPLSVKQSKNDPPISFRNDLMPALMSAGCNTGTCHGSAQGKNGFRMSLFGFDPEADFVRFTRESRVRRVNVALPDQSLMLTKPLNEVNHEGGAVFTKDSYLYKIVRRWIVEGAPDDAAGLPTVTGLRILPEEVVMEGKGSKQQFMILATYSDGTDRDVTDMAILSTVDASLVAIDKEGMAVAGNRGEAYIMGRFSTFAVVSKVITIPEGEQAREQSLPPANYIDELVYEKLKKLRITQASLCADDVFLRRVYLDVLGVLPSVDETMAFLEDTAPDKRAKLIDVLLERPEFSELWAMKWAEVLRVRSTPQLDLKGMHRYNDWLRNAITNNKPMDQLVRELLSAKGGNFAEPASNFYLVEREPNLMAENVAQVFMGVQIKCAQCHNHPFERWTMDDYYSFSAFFAQVGRKTSSDPRETIIFNSGSGEVKNLRDGKVMAPKFLGDAQPDLKGRDRREVLAEWLTSPDNPWFAKNLANRVWSHFMGQGIVEPTDDVRVSNPPSNPQLLDELGARLASYKFDMRRLIKDICNSNTYQTSTQAPEESKSDTRNFAYAQLRRLPSEVMLDAIGKVTDTKVKFASLPLGARAVQVANGDSGNYFLKIFGRPSRETACTCERRNEPTLAQVLHLINGDTLTNAIQSGDSRLAQRISQEMSDEAIVEELFLAAYSRRPRDDESMLLLDYISKNEDRKAALEDVYWSILNSKEFVFSH